MEKEIDYYYEDPSIYDGWCAEIYTDGTYKLRDAEFIKRLTADRRKQLKENIEKMLRKNFKGDSQIERKKS